MFGKIILGVSYFLENSPKLQKFRTCHHIFFKKRKKKEKNENAKHSRFPCSTYTILIFKFIVIYRKYIKLQVLKLLSWNCMSYKSKKPFRMVKEMNISPFLFPSSVTFTILSNGITTFVSHFCLFI